MPTPYGALVCTKNTITQKHYIANDEEKGAGTLEAFGAPPFLFILMIHKQIAVNEGSA